MPVTVARGHTTHLEIDGLTEPTGCCTSSSLPIRYGEETVGVISLGRLRDALFSPTDLALLSDLAERTGSGCLQALGTRRLQPYRSRSRRGPGDDR